MAVTIETLESNLKIVNSAPLSGDGGQALTDNFELLDNHILGSGTQHLVGVEVHTSGTEALTASDREKIHVNTGATTGVILTLPNPQTVGTKYTLISNNSNSIAFSGGGGGSVIQVGTGITVSDGSVSSTVPGSAITIVATTSTKWVALSYTGTWSVET